MTRAELESRMTAFSTWEPWEIRAVCDSPSARDVAHVTADAVVYAREGSDSVHTHCRQSGTARAYAAGEVAVAEFRRGGR